MIFLWTGKTGSGKTWLMTRRAFKEWKKGAKIWSNYRLFFSDKNERITYFSDLREINNVRSGIILLDEAQVLLDSRNWADLPASFSYKLTQHRKHGIDFFATTQNIGMIDIRFRQLVQDWRHCEKLIKYPFFTERKPTKFQLFRSNKITAIQTGERASEETGKEVAKKSRLRFHIIHARQPTLYNTYFDIGLERHDCVGVYKKRKIEVFIKTRL